MGSQGLALPLPPPWVALPNNDGFLNEITKEQTKVHPFQRYVSSRRDLKAPEEDIDCERPYYAVELDVSNTSLIEREQPSNAMTLISGGAPRKQQKHWDFRCIWKELGLFGNVNSYGLTIRFFEDGQTVVNFDGLDGKWHFSQLEGSHGPIERYDLFVGAKIRVFGRHLTISATNASTCQWIDEEGKRLLKKQEWLQSKIESVGAVPVVRRSAPIGIKCHFGKKANSGNADLRRISTENKKLCEQLSVLGMAKVAASQE